jgi:hypothetical protein
MAANNDTGPLAGGCLLCFFLLAGTLTGVYLGQPSIGFLAGIGTGIVIALLIWFLDSRRR